MVLNIALAISSGITVSLIVSCGVIITSQLSAAVEPISAMTPP